MIALGDACARALEPYADKPLVIAYSGGGDSTALLAAACGRGPSVAVIVDHALRPGSEDDAARAAQIARDLGAQSIVHRLTWPSEPPTGQAKLRRARYVALAGVARAEGARRILTAHTQDDQAETALIRWSAGSGRRGLAGMATHAPLPIWPEGRGLALERPFLHLARSELRGWLMERGLPWIEDPANTRLDFARIRARAILAAVPTLRDRLLTVTAFAARRAARLNRAALALAEASLRFDGLGVACLDRPVFLAGDPLVRLRILEALIPAVAGAEREPEPTALERLAVAMAGAFSARTLGGVLVQQKHQAFLFSPDPGHVHGRADGAHGAGSLCLQAGEVGVWDGRFALRAATALRLGVDPAGVAPLAAVDGAVFAIQDAADRALLTYTALAPDRFRAALGVEMDKL